MRKFLWISLFLFIFSASTALAQTPRDESFITATVGGELVATPEPTSAPPASRLDITQTNRESVSPLEEVLNSQKIGRAFPLNPLKHAIRNSVNAGVPPNTIVLLLLLPLVVALIAAARHVIGLRGFGIFLPAALAIVFAAIGPIIGIILFMVIVLVSTFARLFLRKARIKLQYLPRMALILWFVVLSVLGILFSAPLFKLSDFTNVSIFPVLILVLLAEDFSKVQLGKSARTAVNLASETIVMALVSYLLLTTESLQHFALLSPELLLIGVIIFNIILGKYVGLRVIEYWRYRKLISS